MKLTTTIIILGLLPLTACSKSDTKFALRCKSDAMTKVGSDVFHDAYLNTYIIDTTAKTVSLFDEALNSVRTACGESHKCTTEITDNEIKVSTFDPQGTGIRTINRISGSLHYEAKVPYGGALTSMDEDGRCEKIPLPKVGERKF